MLTSHYDMRNISVLIETTQGNKNASQTTSDAIHGDYRVIVNGEHRGYIVTAKGRRARLSSYQINGKPVATGLKRDLVKWLKGEETAKVYVA